MTHPITRHRRRAQATALAITITVWLLACGCSPYDEPTRWEAGSIIEDVPAIDWPLGAPDMTNEWIATVYKADAAEQAAINAADYSTPALKDLYTPDQLLIQAILTAHDARLDGTPDGWSTEYKHTLGPTPMQPIKVTNDGSKATVYMCVFDYYDSDWKNAGEQIPATVEDVQESDSGYPYRYDLERDSEGVIRVANKAYLTMNEYPPGCDTSALRPGFFDPAPDFDQEVWSRDFVGPDGVPVPDRQGIMPDGTQITGWSYDIDDIMDAYRQQLENPDHSGS
jgi:hypothetical protein